MTITLAALITDFFMLYLAKERNASRHTVLTVPGRTQDVSMLRRPAPPPRRRPPLL